MSYSKAPVISAFVTFFLTLVLGPAISAANYPDILVHAEKNGAEVVVTIDCPVAAPSRVVWDVLTDYDHMARFISNVEESSVQQRSNNMLRVYQKGKAKRGPLSFSFENVREIELTPRREIHSVLISGDMKSSEFTTQIVAGDGGSF